MRSSLRRSLDGSTDIYPVQFQPSDWFKALCPNVSPKDLTMAADSLVAEYRAKQQRLRSLPPQLSEQEVIEISPEKQAQLANDVESCRLQLSNSQQELITQYGSGAVSAVKAVVSIYKNTADPFVKMQEAIQKNRSAKEGNLELNKKLTIGFRIKKVSIDCGGWFNPTIFKLSDNYYRLADIRVSKGLAKDDIRDASAAGTTAGARLKSLVT